MVQVITDDTKRQPSAYRQEIKDDEGNDWMLNYAERGDGLLQVDIRRQFKAGDQGMEIVLTARVGGLAQADLMSAKVIKRLEQLEKALGIDLKP